MSRIKIISSAFMFVLALMSGCWDTAPPEAPAWASAEYSERYHIVPFECTYSVSTVVEGWFLLIPKKDTEGYDLTAFTGALQCSHLQYESLQCYLLSDGT